MEAVCDEGLFLRNTLCCRTCYLSASIPQASRYYSATSLPNKYFQDPCLRDIPCSFQNQILALAGQGVQAFCSWQLFLQALLPSVNRVWRSAGVLIYIFIFLTISIPLLCKKTNFRAAQINTYTQTSVTGKQFKSQTVKIAVCTNTIKPEKRRTLPRVITSEHMAALSPGMKGKGRGPSGYKRVGPLCK